MTCFHRTHKSTTQLKWKIITLPYHSVEIMGQEKKKIRGGHRPGSTSNLEFIRPLPCWWLSVAVSGSAGEKQLPAKELHFAWKWNRNFPWEQKHQQPMVLPWCTVDSTVQSLSHFRALAVFGSFELSQTSSHNCLPFSSLTSKEL